jgi:hypothetical protein
MRQREIEFLGQQRALESAVTFAHAHSLPTRRPRWCSERMCIIIIKSVISGGERLAVKTRILFAFLRLHGARARSLARTCYAEMSGRAPFCCRQKTPAASGCHWLMKSKVMQTKRSAWKSTHKSATSGATCLFWWINKQKGKNVRRSVYIHPSDANWFGNW